MQRIWNGIKNNQFDLFEAKKLKLFMNQAYPGLSGILQLVHGPWKILKSGIDYQKLLSSFWA